MTTIIHTTSNTQYRNIIKAITSVISALLVVIITTL